MPIRKAIPGRPVSAKWLNDMAVVAEKNRLARSNLMDGTNGEGGTGTRPADYNPLLIFKVTGTTTGGYTFEEVTDPDADGTYTTADSGLSSTGTGLVLVAPAALTLATNDIVLVRRNPLYALRYETLSLLKAGSTSITSGSIPLATTFNLNQAAGVFQNIVSTSLVAGTYYISYHLISLFRTNTVGDYLSAKLAVGAVDYSQIWWSCVQVANIDLVDNAGASLIVTLGSTTTVTLKACRFYSGTVTTSNIYDYSPPSSCTAMNYIKLA